MIDGPLFRIGKLAFYPYGLCMGLGIILCFVFLLKAFEKRNFNDEAINKILIIGIGATAFGILMAAVFQGLYDYIEDPSGGYHLNSMTFYGGLIGGVSSFLIVWNLYVFVIAPRTNIKFLRNNMNASLSDALPIIPIGITIAHAFGRLGCTFAGCCHGAVTDKWYGIYMYTSEFGYAKVVPTQLFECIFLAVLTGVMALLLFKFKFKYNMAVYAIAYGVWRFLIEYARDDHRGSFIPGLTPSQLWSIVIVIVGIGYIFLAKYLLSKFEKRPQDQPPVRAPKGKKATVNGAPEGSISDFVPEERLVPNEPPADGALDADGEEEKESVSDGETQGGADGDKTAVSTDDGDEKPE